MRGIHVAFLLTLLPHLALAQPAGPRPELTAAYERQRAQLGKKTAGSRDTLIAERGALFWRAPDRVLVLGGRSFAHWVASGGAKGCFGALVEVKSVRGQVRVHQFADGTITDDPAAKSARGSCRRRLPARKPPVAAAATFQPLKLRAAFPLRMLTTPLKPTWSAAPAGGAQAFVDELDARSTRLDLAGAPGSGPLYLFVRTLEVSSGWVPSMPGPARRLIIVADQVVGSPVSAPPSSLAPGTVWAPPTIVTRHLSGESLGATKVYVAATSGRCSGAAKAFARAAPQWCVGEPSEPSLARVLELAAVSYATRVSAAKLDPWEAAGLGVWANQWLGAQTNRHAEWAEALAKKSQASSVSVMPVEGRDVVVYTVGASRSVCPAPLFLFEPDTSAAGRAPMLTVKGGSDTAADITLAFSGRLVPHPAAAEAVGRGLLLPEGWAVRCVLSGQERTATLTFDGESHPALLVASGDRVDVSLRGSDLTAFDRLYLSLAYDDASFDVELPQSPVRFRVPDVGFARRTDARISLAGGSLRNGGSGAVAIDALVRSGSAPCKLRDAEDRPLEILEGGQESLQGRCAGSGWSIDPRLLTYRDVAPELVTRLATGQGLRYVFVANYLDTLDAGRVLGVDVTLTYGGQPSRTLHLPYLEMKTVPFLAELNTTVVKVAGVVKFDGGGSRSFAVEYPVDQGAIALDASLFAAVSE